MEKSPERAAQGALPIPAGLQVNSMALGGYGEMLHTAQATFDGFFCQVTHTQCSSLGTFLLTSSLDTTLGPPAPLRELQGT